MTDDTDIQTEATGTFDYYVAQLETYLDGELDASEAALVRQRLTEEPAYAAALERLHAERVARAAAFDYIERDEVDADAPGRITLAARKMSLRERATGLPRWARIAGGVAACVLVGFGAGLMGPFDLGTSPAKPNSTPYAATDRPDATNVPVWVLYDENNQPVRTRVAAPADLEPQVTRPER